MFQRFMLVTVSGIRLDGARIGSSSRLWQNSPWQKFQQIWMSTFNTLVELVLVIVQLLRNCTRRETKHCGVSTNLMLIRLQTCKAFLEGGRGCLALFGGTRTSRSSCWRSLTIFVLESNFITGLKFGF